MARLTIYGGKIRIFNSPLRGLRDVWLVNVRILDYTLNGKFLSLHFFLFLTYSNQKPDCSVALCRLEALNGNNKKKINFLQYFYWTSSCRAVAVRVAKVMLLGRYDVMTSSTWRYKYLVPSWCTPIMAGVVWKLICQTETMKNFLHWLVPTLHWQSTVVNWGGSDGHNFTLHDTLKANTYFLSGEKNTRYVHPNLFCILSISRNKRQKNNM